MGESYVTFADREFCARNGVLEIWFLLVVDQIDKLPNVPRWLKYARDDWYRQATIDSSHVMFPNLDGILIDDGRRRELLQISEQALKRLRELGDPIKVADLNALAQGFEGGPYRGDMSARMLTRVGDYFVRLLKHELGPDENDAWISE